MKLIKKAQLTVFIIVGLIVLIGFGALLFLMLSQEQLAPDEIIYPPEVRPVANLIVDCARESGEQAAILAGQQGGYVTLPKDIEHELDAHLALDKQGLRKIPFWYVQGESRIPSLNFIQGQVAEFVKTNTEACINNFQDLEQQFDIEVVKDMSVEAQIGDENMFLIINYPLRAKQKGAESEFLLEEYLSIIPVRLKRVHDLAKGIMEAENQHLYLENLTLDLMTADPDIPFDGMSVSCSPEKWRTQAVKQQLQTSLKYNLPNTRFKNTNFAPFLADQNVYEDIEDSHKLIFNELENGLEDIEDSPNYPEFIPPDSWQFFHQFFDQPVQANDLKVAVLYDPSHGLELIGNPSDGGTLSSNLMEGPSSFLRFLCLNVYHFVYDVQYPVRVVIQDPKSFQGRGYTYEFAFPVQIDDNNPAREVVDFRSFQEPFQLNTFCSDFSNQAVDIRARGFTAENLPPLELDNVEMVYQCFNNRCNLGTTKADGGVFRLKTLVPQGCANPLIRAEKEGYVPGEGFLTTNELIIKLTKLKKVKVEAEKHPFFTVDSNLREDGEPLQNNEHVAVFMKAVDHDHEIFFSIPGTEEIEIVDDTAKYNIDATLFRGNTVLGGYHAKNLTIPFEQLRGRNTFVMKVFEQRPLPSTDLGQAELASRIFEETFREELKPALR